MIAPFGLAQLPGDVPAGEGRGSPCVALGVLGSGIAYLLYFAIIASAGASRAILVTYLVPAFALVYGAVFLDEAVDGDGARRPRARPRGHGARDRPGPARRRG